MTTTRPKQKADIRVDLLIYAVNPWYYPNYFIITAKTFRLTNVSGGCLPPSVRKREEYYLGNNQSVITATGMNIQYSSLCNYIIGNVILIIMDLLVVVDLEVIPTTAKVVLFSFIITLK